VKGTYAQSLDQTCAAGLPAVEIVALADLRGAPGIRVILAGDRAWVRWSPGDERVLRRVLAVPGVELYDRRNGAWHPHGRSLPAFGVPLDSDEMLTLDRAITPLPVRPSMPGQTAWEPLALSLARDTRPRPASALRCRLLELTDWVDTVPTAQLSALLAAREGERVMLLGQRLPTIREGEKFWGDRVLTPLGFRPEPDLPESALLGALGVDEGDLLVIEADGCEVVPRDAFRPLSRAGYRLALAEAAP
jgi:hypothetical protein